MLTVRQTFVAPQDFTIQVPCFNVTSDNFNAPTPSTSSQPLATPSQAAAQNDSSGGLSGGTKAGIAVGSIIAGLAIFGAIGFFLWRRGRDTGLKGKDNYELRAKDLRTSEGDSER